MQAIGQLISKLRDTGFNISTAESIDAHQLMCSAQSIEELRLGFRMLFAKSRQEQDLFDMIWEMNYEQLNPRLDSPTNEFDGDMPIQPPQGGSDAEYCPNPPSAASGAVGSNDPSVSLIQFSSDFKATAKQLIQGNNRNAAAILLRYLLSNNYTLSELQQMQDRAMAEINSMLQQTVPDHSEDLMYRLDRELDQLMREQMEEDMDVGRNPLKVQNIEELQISQLKRSPELQQALKRLGKKLASKHRRKIKKGKKKINLRQTIRANIQRGGVMLELRKQQPRVDKPRLTILIDVSPSTIRATQLFLSIIWHAKEVFLDIKFYEFIASVIDTTADLKRAKSPIEGIEATLKKWDRQISGKENSDYYTAFRQFQRKYASKLSQKDSIILLGDLRDWLGPWRNDQPLSASVMGEMAKKVKRFIVLNPEPKQAWNTGDSIVQYVKARGIEVYEATTLQKLIDVLLTL